jgi:hypothetical protein
MWAGRALALLLPGALAAGCRPDHGPTDPNAVRGIVVTVASPQIQVGSTTVATARLLDGGGNEVRDKVAAWLSLTPTIVNVTDAGVITGLQPGVGSVRASSGAVASDVVVLVYNPPASSVRLARDTATLALPGGSVQAIASAFDAVGSPILNPTITWTSLQPLVAAVNAAGLVSAVASGSAAITATVDGISDTLLVTVRPTPVPNGPVVTTITPAALRPGGTYLLGGTNFAPTPSANQVLVDGLAATVLAVAPNQLTVVLPVAGFACEPARDAFVQVNAAGVLGGRSAPLEVARRLALAPGQSALVVSPDDARCTELVPGAGRWAVTAYNATRTAIAPGATSAVSFQLRGIPGLPLTAAAAAAEQSTAATIAVPPAAERHAGAAALAAERHTGAAALAAGRHAGLLEWNLAALARGRPSGARPAGRLATPTRAQRDLSTPGAITTVRLPNLDAADPCVTHTPIGGRTVYVGPHVVILEDTVETFGGRATLRGQMDDYFARLGDEFESVQWPIVTSAFGNPLAMDEQLAGIGKVVMVFSPRVNAMQGGAVTGFVANCDFFAVGSRPSSNGGAFFYAAVPTSAAAGYTAAGTRDQWMRAIRSTLVHEAKHLAAFAERLSRGLPLEDLSWEEGTARVAEEMYARALYGTAAGANTGYAPSIGCDIRFDGGVAPCANRPLLMLRHFDALYSYYAGPEIYSPLGRAGAGDVTFYGGAWSFLRWAADHAAVGEAQFFRDFTTSPVTGVANVEARTGRPWEESLGEWTLAAYLDDVGGYVPANARLAMPSWNYPDLWVGMCTDMGPCANPSNAVLLYTRSVPFSPRHRSFGAFQVGVSAMVGGGFTLLDLAGPGFASQAIELRALGGAGDAPATVRLAVTRIR